MKGYSFRSLTDLVLKIFKIKVIAGTGLSGGGSLEADRTLSVKYGTVAGTATQGNDSRIVNSVQTSGNQTIEGIKTFSSFPITPSSAPTTNYQTANKKYVDDKVAGLGIGVGQTWQDVTESRVSRTTYTNTTEKSIFVSITAIAVDASCFVFVGNVRVGVIMFSVITGVSEDIPTPVSFVVPAGASYSLTGQVSYLGWSELR